VKGLTEDEGIKGKIGVWIASDNLDTKTEII
jgi:hypothetical protein